MEHHQPYANLGSHVVSGQSLGEHILLQFYLLALLSFYKTCICFVLAQNVRNIYPQKDYLLESR